MVLRRHPEPVVRRGDDDRGEIDELAWFAYADRPRVPPVDQLLFDDLKATGQLR